MTTAVVQFSSGVTSWAAAKRAATTYDDLVLVFADVNGEDEDNYRFLPEAAANIGAPLVRIDNDGRTIWDVFRQERFLGNSQADPCSRVLKREPLKAWVEQNCDPDDTVIIFGFTYDEPHRHNRSARRLAPWRCDSPLMVEPWLSKDDVLAWCRSEGVEPPRLYAEGFPHANCGGGCVKAGEASWERLLRLRPRVFAEWERNEQEFRDWIGKDVSILRKRRKGHPTVRVTLREFRERLTRDPTLFDPNDEGACSCMDPPAGAA